MTTASGRLKANWIELDRPQFQSLCRAYRRKWRIDLVAADAAGRIVLGAKGGSDEPRRLAIEEALRWGEPTIVPGSGGQLLWAVPLMRNAQVLGGLIAAVPERRVLPRSGGGARLDVRKAAAELRRLAEDANLTNAALLESRRGEYQREQKRAEAIHDFKVEQHVDIRWLYLREEPRLLAAIRRGDLGEARAILNRLLVGMIHRAGSRLDLAKSFFMELIVTMSRTAVEAGGATEQLLGANFASISQLSSIQDEQQLAPWLHEMLERIMGALRRQRARSHSALLGAALRFMAEHCGENISREDVANVACVSPSHFSRLFRKHVGQNFVSMLSRMRVDRACELLRRSEKDLKIIALEAGFSDQSYFTKVFRRLRNQTPAQYRRAADDEGA